MKSKTQSIHTYVIPEIKQELIDISKRNQISLSSLVRNIIIQYLENNK